jgi:hypothetical protein
MTLPTQHSGARRALVIACQIHGLVGCHHDADLVTDLLDEYGFEILSLRGPTATRASILDAYERLIEVSRPADTVVVYYAGHGSRATAQVPVRPTELRFILPTDIDETDAENFRGILADELSILQWRLTMRTANVTTLLDCCYSARMSRDVGANAPRVRGWDARWPIGAVVRRWQAAIGGFHRLRETYPGSAAYDANPLAVRMVACNSHQRAYEAYAVEFDAVHGLFTAALVSALRSDPLNTWAVIGERVRQQVLAQMPMQRPEAEGPVHRVVFTVTERGRRPAYPVRVDSVTGLAWLDAAALHGIEPGDEVLLAEAGVRPDPGTAPIATITALYGQAALLQRPDGEPIPAGTTAHEWRHLNRDRLVVRLLAEDGAPLPRAFYDGLTELPDIRVLEHPTIGAIATVMVADGRYLLNDAAGRPLYRSARPADAAGASRLRRDLIGLATSLRLQSLDSTANSDELATSVSFAMVGADGPVIDDTVLHVGDWLKISVGNGPQASGIVYANILDLGVAGSVAVLNTAEPAGIALLPGESRVVGAGPEGHELGIPLSWPPPVPDDNPWFETVVAVFSDRPQDLRDLGQDGVTERGHGSRLARLLRSGQRDLASTTGPARYAIRRVTILLCPGGHGCTHSPGPSPSPGTRDVQIHDD